MTGSSRFAITVILVVGLLLGVLIYFAPAILVRETEPQPTFQHLQAGGTSVVEILMQNRWRAAYRDIGKTILDYASTGSTKGVDGVIDGSFALGFTHAPLTDSQRKKATDANVELVDVPVVLCAVVPVYNVKELKAKLPLRFTADVLEGIFLGKITKWNDPALQELNNEHELPDKDIIVVHRDDSSGTTLLFTEYLANAGRRWREEVGPPASEIKKWPTGVGKTRSVGVADYVERTDGAIGYVDLVHTAARDFQFGAVQNKDASDFLQANAANITAAAEAREAGDKASWSLVNLPGRNSYPITGVIWAVCTRTQREARSANPADFLRWVLKDGQAFAGKTLYAPLSPKLVQLGDERLRTTVGVQ